MRGIAEEEKYREEEVNEVRPAVFPSSPPRGISTERTALPMQDTVLGSSPVVPDTDNGKYRRTVCQADVIRSRFGCRCRHRAGKQRGQA